MNKGTQKQRVYNRLMERGYITRNECLRVFVSRLGAIIGVLRAEKGLNITGRYVKSGNSLDYVYKLVTHPANQPKTLEERGYTIEWNCEICKKHVEDYPNKRHEECK